jgi:hypothetical protein
MCGPVARRPHHPHQRADRRHGGRRNVRRKTTSRSPNVSPDHPTARARTRRKRARDTKMVRRPSPGPILPASNYNSCFFHIAETSLGRQEFQQNHEWIETPGRTIHTGGGPTQCRQIAGGVRNGIRGRSLGARTSTRDRSDDVEPTTFPNGRRKRRRTSDFVPSLHPGDRRQPVRQMVAGAVETVVHRSQMGRYDGRREPDRRRRSMGIRRLRLPSQHATLTSMRSASLKNRSRSAPSRAAERHCARVCVTVSSLPTLQL